MNRLRSALLLIAVLFVTACATSNRGPAPAAVYDLGLPGERLAGQRAWSRLAIEVRSPAWFDSLNIDYRLAYEDPQRLREYGGSRWAGSPAVLIGQRLRQQLGAVTATGVSSADCLLRVDVQEFSQVFSSVQESRGVLRGAAALTDAKRRLVAETLLNIEHPAPTADAAGGAKALAAATDDLVRRIHDWLVGLERDGQLGGCRLAN